MGRALLALTVALLAASLAGCLDRPPEGPDLAALGTALTVHIDEGACRVPMTIAEETGLLEAASDAIARIHNVHRRAFVPGQVEAILDESRYVQVRFPPNTTIELPSYPETNATQFDDLYLIWNTTAEVDNVLSNGGEYGTTYPMGQLEEHARAAVERACPGGPNVDEPDGTYRLAWIYGEEQVDPPPPGVCDVRFDHGIDVANRTLVYRADGYGFDPANVSRMIAFDVWERPSQCPAAYRLAPNVDNATGSFGDHGSFEVSFAANGTVNVDGQRWLGPGETTTITYSRQVEQEGRERWRNGTIHVERFAGWPRSELEPR